MNILKLIMTNLVYFPEYNISELRDYIKNSKLNISEKSRDKLAERIYNIVNGDNYLFKNLSLEFLNKFIKRNKYDINGKSEEELKANLERFYKTKFISNPNGQYYENPENVKDFPYYSRFALKREIMERFENLKGFDYRYNIKNTPYKLKFGLPEKYINRYVLFVTDIEEIDDYTLYNNISDYFQEECRNKCAFGNELPRETYFEENKFKLASKVLERYGEINDYLLKEQLYEEVRACTIFKPYLIKMFIDMFSAKSVLDFSSGWGDRLIGFLSSDAEVYYGFDPNSCLHPNYIRMIDFFEGHYNSSKDINLFEEPFDKIGNELIESMFEKFDLVMTSPPYFDLEKYTDDEKQSIQTYNKEDNWVKNFLFKAVDICISSLKFNGHLVLNIYQSFGNTYVNKLIKYMETKKNVYFLGTISYTGKIIQPIFIWKKSLIVPEELYNPPIVIENYDFKNISFQVIQEGHLVSGTKQRSFVKMFEDNKYRTFYYCGNHLGYAQIAGSYAAKLTNKNFVLYLQGKPTYLTRKAIEINPNIKVRVFNNEKITDIEKIARDVIRKNNKYSPENLSYKIDFGGIDSLGILTENIRKAVPRDFNPARIWLVAGSATILQALYKVFPGTYFNVVQVGRKIYDDQLEKSRTSLYVAPQFFEEPVKGDLIPPYKSLCSYDAKVWQFFIENGRSGDVIWNVA